jgi:hypothetical protein
VEHIGEQLRLKSMSGSLHRDRTTTLRRWPVVGFAGSPDS